MYLSETGRTFQSRQNNWCWESLALALELVKCNNKLLLPTSATLRSLRSRTLYRLKNKKLRSISLLSFPTHYTTRKYERWRDEKAFGAFERTVLRKVFGADLVSDEFWRRWNHCISFMATYVDTIVKRIKTKQMRLLSHVLSMDDDTKTKSNFDSRPMDGQRKRGFPRIQPKEQVHSGLFAFWM